MKSVKNVLSVLCFVFMLTAASKSNQKVIPVDNFDPKKFMGVWHEIARPDYFVEKNWLNVEEHYSVVDYDAGKYEFVSKYIDKKTKKPKSLSQVVKRDPKSTVGLFKVSFLKFIKIYFDYNVVWVDEKYENAVVMGGGSKYVWILSRKPMISKSQLDEMMNIAYKFGAKEKNIDIVIEPTA